jgi:putative toxin-antitoxin system antitoxin component (TIGR02293 family)
MIETAKIMRVLGGEKKAGMRPANGVEFALALRAGLQFSTAVQLARHTGIPLNRIFAAVNLSPRTMERRRLQKRMTADESQKIARFARVVALGDEVLADPQVTSQWLRRANRALGGIAPIDLLDTDDGAREVEAVLMRLEHGVYS